MKTDATPYAASVASRYQHMLRSINAGSSFLKQAHDAGLLTLRVKAERNGEPP
jgi:hypothetical protein